MSHKRALVPTLPYPHDQFQWSIWHHNEIFVIKIKQIDYDTKNLFGIQKASGLWEPLINGTCGRDKCTYH